MILEVAIVNVRKGEEKAFEDAFSQAQQIIASMGGYRSHELKRCIEQHGRYLLLVHWDTIEHHTEGFRNSEAYQKWKLLLHHFYDPFPIVEHYETVNSINNKEHLYL
jgi:heme-degrading monooxygenase HmoA